MADFADVEDPAGKLKTDPAEDDAATLKQAIQDASWQLQAVNWIYEQVTGQNLVDQLISPITGDFSKIEKNAQAWGEVGAALSSVRKNLNAGVSDLRESWDGAGAMAFETMMVGTWTVALEADAKIAELVGSAFQKAADSSRMLCDKVLELLTKLINRLIQAACTAWIPVGGWANAVRLVIRCLDIVFMILDMIQALYEMYQGIVQMVNGVKATGTALMKIPEIDGMGDVVNVSMEVGAGVSTTVEGATQARAGATGARRSVGDIRNGRNGGGSSGTSGGSGSPEGYQTALSGNL